MDVRLDKPILFDHLKTVVPSDNAELDSYGYVFHTDATDRDIRFKTVGGEVDTITLAPKEYLFVQVKQVYATGTTAAAGTVKLYV